MPTQTPERPATAAPGAPPPESDPVAQTMALLQPWIDYVPQRQRRLGIFIFAAVLVHLAAFYFITIDFTRAELRHQARSHVTVGDTPAPALAGASQDDSFWDHLNDPRLFLLPLQPVAGFGADEPAPGLAGLAPDVSAHELPPPAAPDDYRFAHSVNLPLGQRVEDAMAPSRQPFTYEENPRPIAAQTTWQWDDNLAQREPSGLPGLPSPVSDTELQPTQLRVAVGPGGGVEHVFVEQSCGSGRLDLDQQAVLAARKIRFKATDEPGLVWGRLTVFWRYSAKPREEVVPTPPSGP